ncbi:tRNA 2-thiouridine(34) synthase MnmA [Pantoea sp. Aalb]|uniref:tRNA 2-thiouridine(34) synthase MnmA n=1 Tax=Pantoea sp. Aalb TaxID=2576762 RepID=UPI001328ED07|nr:tRNA 2-thiouridine(34) synthase MnmA [Pantoea sp. Aalb]MXP67445.1 tRNA 2-thiouridine(34) synthase MnmA [Pantoea sp. Aalb]
MFYNNEKKVIVGMSGGVDSSVSAWLLQKQGYHVEGVFMKNWEEDDNDHCTANDDLNDVKIVCHTLGIKLHKINFASEYWDYVFELFLKEHRIGRTPNPDILCNKEIKFKVFLDFALEDLNADFIATGHYVRSQNKNGNYYLLRGFDQNKDQSYFLYTLNQQQIAKSLFPVGTLKKNEVRRIAEDIGLINAKKKDSTGICFIGKRKLYNFLSRYLPTKPGAIKTVNGEIVGIHQGLMYYTLGQRKGLGIGGQKHYNNNGLPWYVVDKDLDQNNLIIAQGSKHPQLMSVGLIAKQLHWVNQKAIIIPLRCTAKIRYRQKDVPCKLISYRHDSIEIHFDEPIIAVTPGQSIVLYLGDICLGGGIIEQRLPLIKN